LYGNQHFQSIAYEKKGQVCVLPVVSGDASGSKPQEVKRLPGGKVKKKVGSNSPYYN
jgi:hypothetical protein